MLPRPLVRLDRIDGEMNRADDLVTARRADAGPLFDGEADDFGIAPQGRTGHGGEQQNGKGRLSHGV